MERPVLSNQIEAIEVNEEGVRIALKDGRTVSITDEGQDCCEHRYMTCQDTLDGFVGAMLIGAEVRESVDNEPEFPEGGDDCHDVEFLVVTTSLGSFTCATHNEHNGYYGGFSVRAKWRETAGR